jgi:endonuclease-3 related protein
MPVTITIIYNRLFDTYGPQGWWPLLEHDGSNPTRTGDIGGYHPENYRLPETQRQQFEICIGAILTQNTAWMNVEKALHNLDNINAISAERLLELSDDTLKAAIKPSGYFNMKAKKLQGFATFWLELGQRTPKRDELLAVWGIGPETADCMRLYAWQEPDFVIDAYTRRILEHLRCIPADAGYDETRAFCVDGLEPTVPVYQECHALFVEHAKRHYARRPFADPLLG